MTTIQCVAFVVAVSLLVIAASLLSYQSPDAPPRGYVKFFHAFTFVFLGLAVAWAVVWAVKWRVSPSGITGSIPDEALALVLGTPPLVVLAALFAGVQMLCDFLKRRR